MNTKHALACALCLAFGPALQAKDKSVLASPGGSAAAVRRLEDGKATFSLSEAISAAHKYNPEIRALEAAAASAAGGVATAKSWANPELTVEPGVRRSLEDTSFLTSFNGVLGLSQPFKFPGKRTLEIAIAKSDVKLRSLAIEGFKFQMAAKVSRAFYDLLAAQKVIAARTEQVASAKTFVDSARKRTESGYAGEFESMKGQADLIVAQAALREAEGRAASARIALNTLMARPPSAALALSGSLDNLIPNGGPRDFIGLAMARNPALRALEIEAEKSGLSLKRARMEKLPDFSIGSNFEYYKDEQTVSLTASAALPVWNQNSGGIQTAAAQQNQCLAEIQRLRLELGGGVAAAAAKLEAARDQLAYYSPEFLSRMRDFVRQAEEGYAQSATTLIIYLDAKRTYFDALISYYEALGRAAECRADLESSIGVPIDLKL